MAAPMQVRVPGRPRGDMDSLAESGRIRAPETCGEAVASEARVRGVPVERRGNGILPEVCAAPSFHSRRGGRGRRKAGRRLRRARNEERPGEARGKTRARRRASLRQVDFRASSCHGQMDVHLTNWTMEDDLSGTAGERLSQTDRALEGLREQLRESRKEKASESAFRVNSVLKVSTPGKARPDRGKARGVGAARERSSVQENGREGDFHSFV